ncbi:hypothetical protein [Pseudomonas sichuanensis]|uniref:hypothetical protein n=1 Tax=Pseudomonas sichuanensis TaxID=2213015 RepID=UPI002ABB6156|nr:hypothetical protein [Pseudomonas sichuanensis]MDZ4021856.1 hypothetical protein [Pseudomonas sichuanensis]
MSELEKKLQHLTAEQIEVLYAQYLAGEKVSVLLDRYAIDLKPTQLIKALPPRLIEDLICPYCNTPLFQRRPAKSALGGAKQPAFCSRCEHQHHFPYYHRPLRRASAALASWHGSRRDCSVKLSCASACKRSMGWRLLPLCHFPA